MRCRSEQEAQTRHCKTTQPTVRMPASLSVMWSERHARSVPIRSRSVLERQTLICARSGRACCGVCDHCPDPCLVARLNPQGMDLSRRVLSTLINPDTLSHTPGGCLCQELLLGHRLVQALLPETGAQVELLHLADQPLLLPAHRFPGVTCRARVFVIAQGCLFLNTLPTGLRRQCRHK